MKLTLNDGMVIEGSVEEIMAFKSNMEVVPIVAEDGPAEEPLKVGDFAKVVNDNTHQNMLSVLKGTVVEIVDEDGSDIPYKFRALGKTTSYWAKPEHLVRATPEEVAEAKAKLEEEKRKAEEAEKWAKIGRKVGEFKTGDVVRVLHGTGFVPIGAIGIIAKCCSNESFRVNTFDHTESNWHSYGDVELIAPVESVVNLSVSE